MQRDPIVSLMNAVRNGDVETARKLINTFDFSHWWGGYFLLRKALKNQHEELSKLLLQSGCEVNSTIEDLWMTPLHFAVANGYAEIVSMLLDRNANVYAGHLHMSPFQYAVQKGSLEIVKLLINREVCTEAISPDELTAFHCAVHKGHFTIAVELLNHGGHMNAGCVESGKNGYTAFHWAAMYGDEPMIQLLLSKGAKVNATDKNKITPLHVATDKREDKIVKLLLENGANVDSSDEYGKTILFVAVKSAHWATIEHILNFRPDVNSEANRNSLYAAVNGSTCNKLLVQNIVDALQRYGFTFRAEDAKNTKLLYTAVERGYLKIVEALLKLGADVNTLDSTERGVTLLHTTAARGQFEITELLLSHGADVNAQDSKGNLAIYYAILNNDASTTKLLLTDSVSVAVMTELFHTAVKRGKWAVLKILLNGGVNINARQKNGTTALHIASKNGHEEVVKVLVEQGADLDAKDNEKSTPLHFATINGQSDVVNTLLKLGASVDAKDKLGKTALHIAAKLTSSAVAMVLLGHGADINITCEYSMTPLDYSTSRINVYTNRNNRRLVSQRFECDFDDDGYSNHYPFDDYHYSNSHLYDYAADDYPFDSGFPRRNCDANDFLCTQVAEILKQHIIKMIALNLYSDENLRAIYLPWEYRGFLKVCQNEIENMRTKKIGDSNVSFYDVITRGMNQLAVYARVESIVQVLESEHLSMQFPTYHIMITRRFKEGQKRVSLLRSSLMSLHSLSGYALPDLSTVKLFNCLSNKDLENLVKADSSADDYDI